MKLLIIVPHPDDEVYGAAGTILDHVQAGETVGLLTLTQGEAGRTLELADGPEDLGRVRAAELRACLDVLGVQVHEHLNYPDKYLNTVEFAQLVAAARSALERHRPEVLLTFPPNGSNGHPDHVTTHRAVRAAWDALPAGQCPELWYYASDTPPENEALLAEWLPANLRRDVTRHVTSKLQAISCHRTQALSTVDFIRRFPERVTSETFYRVDERTRTD